MSSTPIPDPTGFNLSPSPPRQAGLSLTRLLPSPLSPERLHLELDRMYITDTGSGAAVSVDPVIMVTADGLCS